MNFSILDPHPVWDTPAFRAEQDWLCLEALRKAGCQCDKPDMVHFMFYSKCTICNTETQRAAA